jgi:hypothetical protein
VLVTHEFTASCRCPVDQGPDHYEVRIETGREIAVETILAAAQALAETAQFQERFTQSLARQIGARVTTIGYHSGVKTTCSAS